MLAQLEADFPKDIRVVYRHFPLISIHDKAALAAQAADAAGLQGQFWVMHDLLFERQAEWSSLSVDQFRDWLVGRASELGLDRQQFAADMLSPDIAAKVQKAWEEGAATGIPGTPFLLINSQYYGGPRDYGNISAVVKIILLEERQFTSCPPMTIDLVKQYFATLRTSKGEIVIELYPKVAPMAVNSFVFLAHNGWFDGVTFHRVIPSFVVQSGDPTGTGFGGPGYAFGNEISPDLKFDRPGVVGMANAGPDSNGSQFFITLVPAAQLNGEYTIFGQVVSGMDVVESLAPRNPQENASLPPGDKILSVAIEEK